VVVLALAIAEKTKPVVLKLTERGPHLDFLSLCFRAAYGFAFCAFH
jgi:hypothetical protein